MDNTIRTPLTPARIGNPAAPPNPGALRPVGGRPGQARLDVPGVGPRPGDEAAAEARVDTAGLLRGPADLLDEGLGRAELPPPLELMAALEAAQRHAPLADRAVPGLGRLLAAVIDDERFKLARMMDLGR